MTFKKRLFSALLAGSIAATTIPVFSLTSVALDTSYREEELVDADLFYDNNGEFAKAVVTVLEKQLRKDYDEFTYGDLLKIQTLDLSGLELDGLPKVIEYCHRMRTLNLSENLLRSADVNYLDMSYCVALTSVDISDNYLTAVPSWFVSMDISKKDISNNLIATTNQRSVVLGNSTYYFMIGDTVDVNEFKDKVLSTIKLNDGTKLPDFFYDPTLPTYNMTEEEKRDEDFEKNTEVYVEIDLDKYLGVLTDARGNKVLDEDGNEVIGVIKTGTINGEAGIYTAYSNQNTATKFKVYLLDGNDPTSVKVRLETLVGECGSLNKNDYTTTSWTSYEAALKSAQTILKYSAADIDMLKNALDNLSAAKDNLVVGVTDATKSTLKELISIAKKFNEQDYSTSSWKQFQKAVDAMQECLDNPDASIAQANAAIKDFQNAQAALTATLEVKPEKILKSKFDAIYGEDKTVTAKGVTRGGYKYSWVFNGNDITTPADFDPEIKYESKYEENIRYEVGSASDYQLITFTQTGAFPGTAVVTLDVSAVYTQGTYRLYKWNTSAKKSEFVKEVTIENGEVEFTVDNGGDYFISSVLQNFQMISSNFNINHDKLTITGKFKKKYSVADFRSSVENGEAVTILAADGSRVLDSSYIATGMTAAAPNSDVAYTIIVPGDCDGDGNVTSLDSVEILRAIVGEEALTTYCAKAAADVNGDGWVRVDDAVAILKYCIGME
ncbi:MAG: dockerin type I domain-containing protein [Oscillospiraceae bacterium]